MPETIDISEPIATICERLGLYVKNVARLDCYPSRVSVEVYDLDENGSKFVRDDGNVAMLEPQEFAVTT